MNRQIDEMAKEIRAVKEYIGGADCITGERRVGESHSEKIARHLIEEKGYRKSSEVAREIFEEIEEKGKVDEPIVEYYILSYSELADLKKKYEGEGVE